MTSKREAETWYTEKRLDRYGFDADPNRVRIYKSETPKHVTARFLCGYVLQKAGRAWDVECTVTESGDRVDVLDFGDFDEDPLAIELESAPDSATVEDKLERYVYNGPCRDILPLDLRDCPNDIAGIVSWLQSEVGGV